MLKITTPLYKLPPGGAGKVSKLIAQGNLRRRMQDLGIIDGTVVETLFISPSGDPKAYRVRGAVIALRSEDASFILVEYYQPSQGVV